MDTQVPDITVGLNEEVVKGTIHATLYAIYSVFGLSGVYPMRYPIRYIADDRVFYLTGYTAPHDFDIP